jgi:hypothetical protein
MAVVISKLRDSAANPPSIVDVVDLTGRCEATRRIARHYRLLGWKKFASGKQDERDGGEGVAQQMI